MQGTVRGRRRRRRGRQKKRWEGNIKEWIGLEFANSQRAVENRKIRRELVAKSSVVPQPIRRGYGESEVKPSATGTSDRASRDGPI